MADFMYLFRGGMRGLSPQEMQDSMGRWRDWIATLAQAGKFKGGDPLEDAGKTVRGKNKTVTDGPYAEAKDLVGGYLLVDCDDLGEATELAKGCPIFQNDGTVEVRAIHKMDM